MLMRLAGVVAALVLLPAAPAWAHGADAPDGTDYRTVVTEVTPAMPGLSVRAVEAGARLELTNRTGTTVEVLGYQNEPYLEVRPDGVYENVRSPAVYLNATLTGSAALPPGTDPTSPPEWRRASTAPVVRWHDHRTHWMESAPPPEVAADPTREHRIRDWVVPLRTGVSTMEARGTLDWVPPPSPGVWWAGTVLAALAVAGLGLAGRFRSLSARATRPGTAPWDDGSPVVPVGGRAAAVARAASAGLLVVAGAAAIGYAVGRELDAGNDAVGAMVRGLFAGQIWAVLTALAAVAAAGYALRRRAAADFALAMAGACVAIFGGAANAAAFGTGVVPVPWPPTAGRLVLAMVIAAGAGVAAAAVLRMRATAGRGVRKGPLLSPRR